METLSFHRTSPDQKLDVTTGENDGEGDRKWSEDDGLACF